MTRTFVIAEVGPNHNGSLELALDMIEKLASVGVDAIKFQLVVPESLYSKDSFKAPYQEKSHKISALEMCKLNQLSRSEHVILFKECKKYNVEYICTAFDLESLRFLNEELNISRFKIASGEILSLDLLDYMRNSDKPILLSTGMATIDEIRTAVDIFKKYDCPFELQHSNSSYPMKDDEANLKCIQTLKDEFGCNVGYSGHESSGYLISVCAGVLGATSIERHITLDRTMYGSDQAASLEPKGLERLVRDVRNIETVLGDGKKRIWESELPVMKKLRVHS